MKQTISLLLILFSAVTFAQEKFSNETIQKFADAYSEIRVENEQMQLNIVSEIEKAGLKIEEFTDIHIKLNDSAQSSLVSKEDEKKYKIAKENVLKFEKETQKMFESIIAQKGLTVETYQEISKACMQNEALNKKVMDLVNK